MTAYNFSVIEPYTYELPKFSYGHMYMQEFEFVQTQNTEIYHHWLDADWNQWRFKHSFKIIIS